MKHLFKTALLASVFFAAPAFAEQDEIIIVTGVRTPTPIERLAARVSVTDRVDIEELGAVSVAEAIGVEAVQAGGAGQQTSVFLRGANSKHALALFDGVRLNDASTPNAQYDFGLDVLGGLDRIEVLRGPASAIYGSDAIGGVVNLIPRRGAETAFAPFLELSAGSFDTRRALMGAAGTSGAFEYGISAEIYDSEGYDLVPERMATHVDDPDGARIATLTASARHDFGAVGLDALFRLRDSETEFDTFSGGPFFDLRADDPDLENTNTQSLWRLGGDVNAGESLSFRVEGGQVEDDRAETDGGFEASAAEGERTFVDASATWRSGDTSLVGGVILTKEDIDTAPQFANPLSVSEDQEAIYAVAQTAFGEHWDASVSVRRDDYESFGAHTTYALGIVGRFDALRVFGSYGTAFKAPSLSERFESSMFNIGNPDLEPEESTSVEIGADWTLNDALKLGASYYQTRIENLINYDFFALQNVNIGEASIDGAEAYAEFAPASWGNVRLSYAWTDATNEDTGAQLARRPENTLRLDARVHPTERLTLALLWTYVGERTDVTYDDAGSFVSSAGQVDSYDVGALSASYDLDDRAELFVRIDNITDEPYEQPAAFAGAPRSAQLGVRARF